MRKRISAERLIRDESGFEATPEAGTIIILASFCIFLILAFGALAIDILRLEGARARIQAVTDAAALGAALQLRTAYNSGRWFLGAYTDPALEARQGWDASKQALFAFIKGNAIPSLNAAALEVANSSKTQNSLTYSAANNYSYVIYDFPDIRIKVQRGMFEKDSGGNLRFVSLEIGDGHIDSSRRCIPDASMPSCSPPNPGDPLPTVEQIANAVKVEVTVKRFGALLGHVLGISSFRNLTHVSIGALDQDG